MPIHRYLRRVAKATLEFHGNVFRPKVPRWVEESSRRLAGSPEVRARRFWRWVSFALPPDLLMAAHPGASAAATEVDLVSTRLSRMLADLGYVEPHMHIGAALDFRLLWTSLMHALAVPEEISVDSFRSPGAQEDEGARFAHWLIRAAISRYVLAGFLSERRSCPDLRLDDYLHHFLLPMVASSRSNTERQEHEVHSWGRLSPEVADWARSVRERAGSAAMPGLGIRLHSALRELALGHFEIADFRMLQRTYAEITGVHRQWVEFPTTVAEAREADPIGPVMPWRSRSPRSPEMDWIAEGLTYLEDLELGKRRDESFAHLFWQTIRVRCRFYRYIVQRPMTPGLQWFVRFYRRIEAARRRIRVGLLVDSAAEICGAGKGLHSLEFRTSPLSTAEETGRLIREMYSAAWRVYERHVGAIKVQTDGAMPPGHRPTGDLEIGLVLHLSRDRGGGMLEGRPTANARNSDADPSWSGNRGYRYASYYGKRRADAIGFARVIQDFPRVLFFLRGIDLCTDELGIPMWVTAPLVRYIREISTAASCELLGSESGGQLGLRTTVHAGEDFVHLLGGMRRIDEAIEQLDLRQRDRIGHALALGTDPRRWALRSGGIAITKMERLLDLTWEWSFSTDHKVNIPASRVQFVMDQVERLSREVFGQFAHPRQVAEFTALLCDPQRLRTVGFPRGPIPPEEEFLSFVYDRGLAGRARAEALVEGGGRNEGRAANYGHSDEPYRLLFAYLVDPDTFLRGQQLELVDPAFEADSLASLQDALRVKVGSRGITIEINPSSNLLIGNLADLQSHPLWRLHPPDPTSESRPIGVCVGSDNPITFCTSTREEYQLVYDTLTLAGLSDHDAQVWIEAARKTGLDSRFTHGFAGNPSWLFRRIRVETPQIIPPP